MYIILLLLFLFFMFMLIFIKGTGIHTHTCVWHTHYQTGDKKYCNRWFLSFIAPGFPTHILWLVTTTLQLLCLRARFCAYNLQRKSRLEYDRTKPGLYKLYKIHAHCPYRYDRMEQQQGPLLHIIVYFEFRMNTNTHLDNNSEEHRIPSIQKYNTVR